MLTLQVADVDALHRELVARGIGFVAAPRRMFWGYGAELRDPSGYLLRVWDAETMQRYSDAPT